MVQYELPVSAPLDPRIQRLDLLENRRVFLPFVLKVHGPLDGREIAVGHCHASHSQSRLGVGIGQGVLGAILIQATLAALEFPGLEQLDRGSITVAE